MLQYALLAVAVIYGSTANAAYSSTSQQSTYTGNTGHGGNTAGASAGGGSFSGSYSGQYPHGNYGGIPSQFPFANPAFHGNQQYQDFVENFWKNFGHNYQNAATMTYATPNAHAYAYASDMPYAYSIDFYQQQLAQQQALYHQFQQQAQGFNNGQFAFGNGYAPNYAGAGNNFAGSAASFGPGGPYQTAAIIPANPNSPNVDTRFGGDDPVVTVSSGPQGFQGISTSSFSSSSDINGQKTSHREASTSVNDNGKVTTYTVKS